MDKNPDKRTPETLPQCAVDYIGRVVAAIRYRRRVRREVKAELTAHFEDALREVTSGQEKGRKAQELIETFGDPKLVAVLCRRAKKRCRHLWQKVLLRGAQALGVFFLYVAVCSLPLFFGTPKIAVNYVQWLSDRWRPSEQGAENAKTYYDRAGALYVKPSKELEDRMNGWDSTLSDCNEADLQLLAPWLAENEPAFEMLRRGTMVASYWPVYDANKSDLSDPNFMQATMDALPNYRNVVLALRRRIAYEARLGQADSALDDCLMVLRFGRHLEGKGLLVEQLVAIAIEAVGYGSMFDVLYEADVSDAALKRLQDLLASDVDEDRCIVSLDGEKAFWYDHIQRGFTDDGHGGGRALRQGFMYADGNVLDNLLAVLLFDYPDRRDALAMVEAHFEQAQEAMCALPKKTQSLGGTGEQAGVPKGNLLLSFLSPAHERVGKLSWRSRTHEAAALTVVAIFRYKNRKGTYPDRLDELVSEGLLQKLPPDPFGSGPLSYDRTADGFLLYSWGENFRDDGGVQGVGSDGKPRLWAENGDWVFWPRAQDP